MDFTPRPRPVSAQTERLFAASAPQPAAVRPLIVINLRLPRSLTTNRLYSLLRKIPVRLALFVIIGVLLLAEIIPLIQPRLAAKAYAFDSSKSLLPDANASMAAKLHFDAAKQAYSFNAGYDPQLATQSGGVVNGGGPLISAVAYIDGSKGVSVTDPVNKLDFKIKPKFALLPAKQQQNRVVYPLADGTGWLIYTMQARQVKEDIVLRSANGDTAKYTYDLDVGDALQVRLDTDGSIGVYGSSVPINGQVSTSTEKDAQLLSKVRKNAIKNNLLFSLPAPYVKELKGATSRVKTAYSLNKNALSVTVSGLKKASYPLTIDPSVYVKSAAKLMRGNNETNIDFDVTNNQILKGSLTGARIPNWSTGPNSLPAPIWNAGVVVAGGYIYVIGGNNGTTNVSTVYWAQFDTTLASTDPNYRDIGTWQTSTGYNLANARIGLSAVAYNGYLFAIGGQGADCASGATAGSTNVCSTVYTSKLGANGEPNTWVQQGNLATERRYAGVAAYENRMYLYGGQSGASGFIGSVATSEYANINPNGTLGTWTTTGAGSQLSAARYGLSGNAYNGYIYAVGGRTAAGAVTTVEYAKITSTGLNSWQTTNGFTTGRLTLGGAIATILNGYIYVSGGCTTTDVNNNCTANATDLQVASINADGTLSTWTIQQQINNVTPTSIARTGYGSGLIGWRGALYAIGGCTGAMTANNCPFASTTNGNSWGIVQSDGFVGPSQGGTTLPGAAGGLAVGVVINNGFIYSVGGCSITTGACTSAAGAIYFMPIASDGSISGAWTATTKGIGQTTGAAVGLAGMGLAVYNNTLFVAGGITSGGGATANSYSAPIATNGDITTNWITTTGTSSAISPASASPPISPFMFARSNPANANQGFLYTVGGCMGGSSSIGCTSYVSQVRRCAVTAAGITAASCADQTMGLPNTGMGIFGGAVYGNYVYIAGGANGTGAAQTSTVYYAKIDAVGNLVNPADGTTASGWKVASAQMTEIRRRTAAFALNGYLYVLAGHDGATGATLSDMQIGKINVQTGDITSFATNPNYTPSLASAPFAITARWNYSGAAANGKIYVVGGCSNGSPPNTCGAAGVDRVTQYVQVYNNYSGSPAQYNTSSAPATTRIGASAVIYNGYIYQAGGCSDIACTTVLNGVESALINPDGTLGAWTTTGVAAMGTARTFLKLLTSNGYLYALGGQATAAATGALSTTEKAQTGSGGTLGAWSAETTLGSAAGTTAAVLTNSRGALDGAVYNGYIYAIGGYDQANAAQTTIYYALLNVATGAIGSWATSTQTFTTGRSGLSVVAYNATLYILGGFTGTNYLPDVQYAKISNAGNITAAFANTTNMPQPVSNAVAYAANGFLYVVGGRSAAAACTNNTYVDNILANSTIANGNNPNGIGNWSQTSVVFGAAATSARYGASVAYDSGKVYIIGGGCTAMVGATAADKLYYSTIQAQPQIAKFAFVVDADSDVFPSKTLFNGLDNGIGASWQLNYRSSTSAAAAWGQNTFFGNIALGTPQAYVPIDAVGAGTNFSRYHYIELTIDVSQAFGYPEDVTRGPTITDLTFQFTSDPSKRLRNGKTFIGGEQQPLDTPF